MFRGRLHVATTDDVSIWYASCAKPCTSSSDWTRIVRQDSAVTGDLYLEAHGTNNGRLNRWHRTSGTGLYVRSKSSE